jgi:hypothetical protein
VPAATALRDSGSAPAPPLNSDRSCAANRRVFAARERIDAGDMSAIPELRSGMWEMAHAVYYDDCPPEWSHQDKMELVTVRTLHHWRDAKAHRCSRTVVAELASYVDLSFRRTCGIPLGAPRKRAWRMAREYFDKRDGRLPRTPPSQVVTRPRERRDECEADPRGPPSSEDDDDPHEPPSPDLARVGRGLLCALPASVPRAAGGGGRRRRRPAA